MRRSSSGPWFKHSLLNRLSPAGWAITALILIGLIVLGSLGGLSSQPAEKSGPAIQNPGLVLLDVFWKLGLVLALIYGCLYLLRRWRGVFPGMPLKRMAVLETTRLSPRQALHLVQVGNQTLLVGATDQNITLLSAVDASLAQVPHSNDLEHPPVEFSFADLFGQAKVENSELLNGEH